MGKFVGGPKHYEGKYFHTTLLKSEDIN
eukprot:UN06119